MSDTPLPIVKKVTSANGLSLTSGTLALGAATDSAAGAQSASDKTKIDQFTVPAGAAVTFPSGTHSLAPLDSPAFTGTASGGGIAYLASANSFVGAQTITGVATTDVPLTIRGVSGQTGDLLDLRNGAGTTKLSVDVSGNIVAAGNVLGGNFQATGVAGAVYFSDQTNTIAYLQTNADGNRAWNLFNRISGRVPFTIQGAASQTADLFDVNVNGGPTLFGIDNSGGVTSAGHIIGSSTATIAAGTGAGSSPTISISGGDIIFSVNLTTGTLPAGSGATVATITPGSSWASAPKYHMVGLEPNAIAAIAAGTLTFAPGTTTHLLKGNAAGLTAATNYQVAIITIAN